MQTKILVAIPGALVSVAATAAEAPRGTFDESVQPLLKQYCLDCHGGDDPEADVRLDTAGVPSTLHIVQGAGHGGKLFQAAEARQVVLDFFSRHLHKTQ